jgi:hypothetical protein
MESGAARIQEHPSKRSLKNPEILLGNLFPGESAAHFPGACAGVCAEGFAQPRDQEFMFGLVNPMARHADGLPQRGRAPARLFGQNQGAFAQLGQIVERKRLFADLLCRFQASAPAKDRQARKEPLQLRRQQPIAPAYGGVQGAMARRRASAVSCQQLETICEPGEHLRWRQDLRTGGGQF